MPARDRKPPPQFDRAAEHRARGLSWDAAARELGRNEKTLREWAKKFPREWAAALRRHESTIAREATAESVHALRKQLRSEDEKIGRAAAASLIQYALTKSRKSPSRKGRPAALAPDTAALAEFVEGLTDAEAETLLRELRAAPPAAGTGADAAPAPTTLAERSE
ncbi:MAG: hypothetical protein JNK93_10935 [Planctomycetia bacterium]|nr:hypothetical protein [Planctomycetia bacterium]